MDILLDNAGPLQAVEIPVMKHWQWSPGDMSQDWAGRGTFGVWNAPCGVAESLHLEKGTLDTYRRFLSLWAAKSGWRNRHWTNMGMNVGPQ